MSTEESPTTHWIAVISRAHSRIAAASEFLQVCHGKAGPLRKTEAGDEVFIYSEIPHMEPSQPVECGSKPLDAQFAFE